MLKLFQTLINFRMVLRTKREERHEMNWLTLFYLKQNRRQNPLIFSWKQYYSCTSSISPSSTPTSGRLLKCFIMTIQNLKLGSKAIMIHD